MTWYTVEEHTKTNTTTGNWISIYIHTYIY